MGKKKAVIMAVDKAGNPVDTRAVQDEGQAFDPYTQHLDLTKDEKRRTTALMMAIQAYEKLIIRDADYLREASDLARRQEGPKIQPATMNAMVLAAMQFDDFIAGRHVDLQPEAGGLTDGAPTQPEPPGTEGAP